MVERHIWSSCYGSRNWDPGSWNYIFLSNSLLIMLAGLALLSEVGDLSQDPFANRGLALFAGVRF